MDSMIFCQFRNLSMMFEKQVDVMNQMLDSFISDNNARNEDFNKQVNKIPIHIHMYCVLNNVNTWKVEKIKFTLSQDQFRKLSNSKNIDEMKEDIENLRLQIDKHITDNNENVKVGEIFIRQTSTCFGYQ